MAQPFTLTVQGVPELIRDIKRYELGVRGRVGAVIARYATLIAREARALAPVDEGDLRRSIRSDVKDALTELASWVLASADHAPFVEFGTGQRGASSAAFLEFTPEAGYEYGSIPGMPAQPYLRPAIEKYAADFVRDVRRALEG